MSPTEDAVKAASKVDMPVLEGLRLALGSLKDPERPWNFGMWTECTCGHIYAGAHRGKMAKRVSPVFESPSPTSRYGKMLQAIIDANGLQEEALYKRSTVVVSDATFTLAGKRARTPDTKDDPSQAGLKSAAITLVSKAIARLEKQERAAMLAVKGGQ